MRFDLGFSMVTRRATRARGAAVPGDASLAACFIGKGLGKLTGLVADPWRPRVYMGPLGVVAAIAFFLLPSLLVELAYPALHPENRETMVCVVMVWPTFLLPTPLGLVAAVRATRSRGASRTAASVA